MNLKRTFDVGASIIGIFILAIPFCFLAFLIKLEDGGQVFFRQERIGRYGHPFRIWKFRSMLPDADRIGMPITVGSDFRITRVGQWMRKFKIDELPQLINVFFGEMSFVGPRPEVSEYVKFYDKNQQQVLNYLPGITDPASIKYRNESELLAKSTSPDAFYVNTIMPDKIRINLSYAEHATFISDILIILKSIFPFKNYSNNIQIN